MRRSTLLVVLELDHVLIAVTDLTAAARDLQARHGVTSVEGGHHPGYGTENVIVPLGGSYVELVTVADAAVAAQSPFGSWVARALRGRGAPLGWAVRTGELDEVARRLGLNIASGRRATRGGEVLRWRSAGIERAAAEPSLPFFLEWAPGTPFPGRIPVSHPAGEVRIAGLELDGDAERIADWLGAHHLPITVRVGPPAVASIALAASAGEIVIGAE